MTSDPSGATTIQSLLERPTRPLRIWPAAPPATFPEHIGPYRVVGIIGEGAMGIVYEAETGSAASPRGTEGHSSRDRRAVGAEALRA